MFCSGKGSIQKQAFAPSHKNSNNPLAVEPETENDAAAEIFSLQISFDDFTSVEAAASSDNKRIYSNDQHVETCDDAWAVAGGRAYSQRQHRPLRKRRARRNATPSNPQCRSDYHGALLQRAAGRRGFAAMPAEEHVEPVIELPERGARRRSAGSAPQRDGQAGRSRAGRSRSAGAPQRQPRRPKPPSQRPQPARRGHSRPARRFPPSAAPAAPTIRRSARACRPAARRRCNAWKRTRRNFRPACEQGRRRRQRRWRGSARGGAAPAAARLQPPPRRPTVIVLRPMRPREELFVLRSACGADVRSICGGVAPGGGRIVQCLATNAALAFARMQGRAVPVRGAINRTRCGGPPIELGPPVAIRRERRG